MSTRPPQSPHSLDAEERALAKGLPRLHGRTAPGPDLDASILAAAQAAVQPATPARVNAKPRIRWIAPASLAASMVLAVGMAWQLRPLPKLQAPQHASTVEVASEPAAPMTEPAASNKLIPMAEAPASVVAPTMASRQQAMPAAAAKQAMPPSDDRRESAPDALPPPPPPAPVVAPPPPSAAMAAKASPSIDSQPDSLQTQAAQGAIHGRSAAPAPATTNPAGMAHATTADKASVADTAKPAAVNSARAAAPVLEVRSESEMASDAGFVDDPEEDVPPATAASPAVRDAWLRRIAQLLEQGNRQEAKASLAEFKRRYPSAVLPPALKALDIEP